MKLEKFYRTAIEAGIRNDLRGADEVRKILAEENEKFKDLKDDEKKYYDPDKLFNPYADSRILFAGDSEAELEIRKIMVGIDIDPAELLLAYTLNRDRSENIDLVLSHHPMGTAQVQLFDVMKLQAALLAKYGVTIGVAEQLMDKRISEIERRLMPINHAREVDAARLLGLPLMCLHTPADNCVTSYLTKLFEREKPAKIRDLMKLLKGIPEYERAARLQNPAKVVSGAEGNSCGKIFVDMTGGTSGSKDIFDQVAAGGVSTIVGMHMTEEHLTNAKKANLNVVIAGHISSDVLGLNLLLDEVEKGGKLEYVAVSGFERIRRGSGLNI
jgi:putative NIF3 family GTP cyclohydrolase 1 type 2